MYVHMKHAFSLMGHCGNPNVYVYIHVCSQVLRMALQDVRTYIYTIHTGSYVVVQGIIVFLQTYNV